MVNETQADWGSQNATYWVGPTSIISRSGQNSFTIITKEGDSREVNAAQLKPYYDAVLEGGAPLHFYRPDYREPASGTPLVVEVLTQKKRIQIDNYISRSDGPGTIRMGLSRLSPLRSPIP